MFETLPILLAKYQNFLCRKDVLVLGSVYVVYLLRTSDGECEDCGVYHMNSNQHF
jgi:hypothetical protein